MKQHAVTLAVTIGALGLVVGMACGTQQTNPLASSNSLDAAARAITTVSANNISGELLALGHDLDELMPSSMPNRPPGPPPGPPPLDSLKVALGLADAQVSQITQILEATRAAADSIRGQVQNGSLTRAQAREQLKALHDQQKAQIEAVLTADQRARFEELRQQHDRQFNNQGLKTFLGLTDDQAAQIEQILRDTAEQIRAIHNQVEAGTLTKDGALTQIQALRTAEQTQLAGVLTAEQLQKFNNILSHRPGPGGPDGHGRPGRPGGRR